MSLIFNIINELLNILAPSWKPSLYFTLTAHLSLDWSHFRCSAATCVSWLLCWAVQATEMVVNMLDQSPTFCTR